jgi:phosphatidylglycerophosphatase A
VPPEASSPATLPDRIALVLATGFGTGYGPLVPGTWGSIPGVALAWAVERRLGGWGVAAAACVTALVGTWAADRAAVRLGEKDPGRVVVDEIAGQLVTLCFLPATPQVLLAGFLLFRAFDIVKPWPARRLEALPGGSGIMADDLMAGLYANLILQGLAALYPALLGVA